MDSGIRAARKGLESIIMVERQSTTSEGKTRSPRSYYMSSLKKDRIGEMQGYIRGHYGIDNSCHWVLDTLFREDQNQTRQRTAAKNLGTLSRIALNALKARPTTANGNASGRAA